MNFKLIVLISCFAKILSQDFPFLEDENCLYEKTGNVILWNRMARIDFFIPWKPFHPTDTLEIKSETLNIILPNPLSTSESTIPTKSLRIGWNTIFIENSKTNDDVIITVGNNKQTIPQSRIPHGSEFRTSGQYSNLNCFINARYYWIPAGKDVVLPFALYGIVDRFDLYSDQPFSVEFTLNKRYKICGENIRTYTIRDECPGHLMKTFKSGFIYNVYLFPGLFDSKNTLRHGSFAFTEFTVHNTGDEGFYLETFPLPESNAPISLLQE